MTLFIPTTDWLETYSFNYGIYNNRKKGYRYSGHINWFYDEQHHMEGWFIGDVKFYPKNEKDVLGTLRLLDKPF